MIVIIRNLYKLSPFRHPMEIFNDRYREYKLDNGLHVILQDAHTPTISGELRISHGSLHERPGEEGLAHLAEHVLLMGGTSRYSLDDVARVRRALEYLNAHTSTDVTSITCELLAEDTPLFVDFAADAAFYPLFDERKLDKERLRVLREIAEYRSSSIQKDFNDFETAFYGENSPYCYDTLGSADVVRAATPDDLRTFHQSGSYANNMSLMFAGPLPPNINELIGKTFADKPYGVCTKYEFLGVPPLTEPKVMKRAAPDMNNVADADESNAHIIMRIWAPDEKLPESYAVTMLSHILATGSNSRLFKAVSQDRGLAYSVGGGYYGNDNAGFIQVWSQVQSKRQEEALDAILGEMRKLQTDLVDNDELERIKKNVRFSMVKRLESSNGYMNAIKTKLESGRTYQDDIDGIASVTPEQVRGAANNYLPRSREEGSYVLLIRDPLLVE